MSLRVIALKGERENEFFVYWRCGLQRQGKVITIVKANLAEKAAVAELAVAQYLVEEKKVLGTNPPLKDLLFEFSSPVIRKLYEQKSDVYHLYPYAYFLTTKFASAVVRTCIEQTWILPRAENDQSELTVSGPQSQFIVTKLLGKIAVTKHVIDQFIVRMNNIEPHEAWKALTQILNSSQLAPIPQTSSCHKYDHEAQRYLDKNTLWCFIIGKNANDESAILSAYIY